MEREGTRMRGIRVCGFVLCALLLCLMATTSFGQVNPKEIRNPQLKAVEEKYFQQLIALNRAIAANKFPYSLVLSRYVGLSPEQQVGTDTRGIEFEKFHERVILKITGNYNAAYNANLLTQNQRAERVFREVVAPILQLVAKQIPPDVTCDAIGFEFSYHVRRKTNNSDYEGKEILVVVFDREDAFKFSGLEQDPDRQLALNRSEIYVNGEEFGLALGGTEPLSNEERAASAPSSTDPGASTGRAVSTATLALATKNPAAGNLNLEPGRGAAVQPVAPGTTSGAAAQVGQAPSASADPATQADVDRLQAKYQQQLDALAKAAIAQLHFVDYAPPSLVLFRNRVYLQVTVRNPNAFEKDSGSIYKRAAQSFDLFLAQQLKALLDKMPQEPEIEGLDITVLNQLTGKTGTSSEAVEFALPLKALRQFVDAGITNQDLINQSVVLVNGVRIALNLQLVE